MNVYIVAGCHKKGMRTAPIMSWSCFPFEYRGVGTIAVDKRWNCVDSRHCFSVVCVWTVPSKVTTSFRNRDFKRDPLSVCWLPVEGAEQSWSPPCALYRAVWTWLCVPKEGTGCPLLFAVFMGPSATELPSVTKNCSLSGHKSFLLGRAVARSSVSLHRK